VLLVTRDLKAQWDPLGPRVLQRNFKIAQKKDGDPIAYLLLDNYLNFVIETLNISTTRTPLPKKKRNFLKTIRHF